MDFVIQDPNVWTHKARCNPRSGVLGRGCRCSGFLRDVDQQGCRVPPQMVHQGAAGPVNSDGLLLLELSVACIALFMRQ